MVRILPQEPSIETHSLTELRVYDSKTSPAVIEHYRQMRINQSLAHVERVGKKYGQLQISMNIWEAIDSLDSFIDVSDPDVDLPNLIHAYQTAEGIRDEDHPDWLQLTGLIHDLGKCVYLRGSDEDGTSVAQQWSIAGDTYVLGVSLPNTLVFPEFNVLSPDNPLYSTYSSPAGIYSPGCGLDNCSIAYGHDEYMYQVLAQNPGVTLPPEALAVVRYHSLYPWHSAGEYIDLENDKDRAMKPWVQLFNQYDLYTKRRRSYDLDELEDLRQYYDGLINNYLPEKLLW